MSPISSDKLVLADHLELFVLAGTESSVSRQSLEQAGDRYWGADSAAVSFAIDEMRHRAQMLEDSYPFDLKKSYVLKARSTELYEALLVLTRSNWFYPSTALTDKGDTKAFEILVQDCLGQFFGPGTRCVDFGWPSESGRPPEFSRAIIWLAAEIGIEPGTAYRQPRRKDGGVDIVVWRGFPDRRAGIPIMLVQATVQSDLLPKSRDIDRRLWSGWLATDVEPLVALAIPGGLSSTEEWNELSRNSCVLDRSRLVGLAPELPESTRDLCESIVRAGLQEMRSRIEDFS